MVNKDRYPFWVSEKVEFYKVGKFLELEISTDKINLGNIEHPITTIIFGTDTETLETVILGFRKN